MIRMLDEAAIQSYRDAGFHTPLHVLATGEALDIRHALEAVEAERGPVFTENPHPCRRRVPGLVPLQEPPPGTQRRSII